MKAMPVLFGLGAGFLLGWLTFGTGPEPPVAPAPAPPAARHVAERDRPPIVVVEGRPRIDVAQTIRTGPLEKLWPLVSDGEREWTDAEVRALIERLDRARAKGNGQEFMAALRGLSRAKTPAAQRKLLALMVDETLTPPWRMGDDLLRGLGDSELPGVVAGARKRFEMNVASGETSWVAGHGYFDLIAMRGSGEDIAWLAARAESGQLINQANEALATSKSPVAVQYVARLIEDGKANQEILRQFARPENSAVAEPLLRRVILGELKSSHRELSAVFRAYGNCIPENGLDAAREFLITLREPMQRVSAVYAVEALRIRGQSVEGFERVVEYPTEFLETATAESDRSIASKARYAIEYNRVAWSERAARALERAAGVFKASSMTKSMVEIAAQVRAGLASPWR